MSQDTFPSLFPIGSLSKYYYSVVYHWCIYSIVVCYS